MSRQLDRKTAQNIVKRWAHSALTLDAVEQVFEQQLKLAPKLMRVLLLAEKKKFLQQIHSHVTKVTLSSAKQDWLTPPYFLDIVRGFGPISLDPCANPLSFVRAWWSFYG